MAGKEKKGDKKHDWFEMYIEAVRYGRQAGLLLNDMIHNQVDMEVKSRAIKDLEHKGDNCLHEFFEKLTNAFITPVDRDVMGEMMRSIDNITDAIEHSASKFIMYDIHTITPYAFEICDVMNDCLAALEDAAAEFKNYKKSARLLELVIEVNRLEELGDQLHRKAVGDLFRNPADVLDVVRWKDIYDTMETVLDSCEDVADAMKTVLLMVG